MNKMTFPRIIALVCVIIAIIAAATNEPEGIFYSLVFFLTGVILVVGEKLLDD